MTSRKPKLARKKVLPTLVITQVCSEEDPGASIVNVNGHSYPVRQLYVAQNGKRSDGRPAWSPFRFNLFPLVLSADGSPWPEANLFVLKSLEDSPAPDMRTFDARALDLADFRRFLEFENIDWLRFSASKLLRPTYRYRGHLNFALRAGEVSPKTVNRRMGTVVSFYRWLIREQLWKPDHPPWIDKDIFITSKDQHGFSVSKTVKSTDLAVHVPNQHDPYSEHILDGGLLRPLPINEQEWLKDALVAAANPEMTLIHLIGLLTGARMQTICTMKARHVQIQVEDEQTSHVCLSIGPGTGIDSKGGKRMVLHIPVWLYQSLYVYSKSERAERRRAKSSQSDENQYLFLTKHGRPYYADHEERQAFNPNNTKRYDLDGGAIGTFIRTIIRP